MIPGICSVIASSSGNGELHIEFRILTGKRRNHKVRIQYFDFGTHFDIRSLHRALSHIIDIRHNRLFRASRIPNRQLLQIHDNLGNVFLDAGNRGKLVVDTIYLHLTDCRTGHGRKKDSSERIPQYGALSLDQRSTNKTTKALLFYKFFYF